MMGKNGRGRPRKYAITIDITPDKPCDIHTEKAEPYCIRIVSETPLPKLTISRNGSGELYHILLKTLAKELIKTTRFLCVSDDGELYPITIVDVCVGGGDAKPTVTIALNPGTIANLHT